MANGTMHGEDSTCKKNDEKCPHLYTLVHDTHRENWDYKTRIIQHEAPKYGEYVDWSATIRFDEDELVSTNAYFTILMYGPGEYIYIYHLVCISCSIIVSHPIFVLFHLRGRRGYHHGLV
jgi:hypothetical protein